VDGDDAAPPPEIRMIDVESQVALQRAGCAAKERIVAAAGSRRPLIKN
jgi:hypothetical protein